MIAKTTIGAMICAWRNRMGKSNTDHNPSLSTWLDRLALGARAHGPWCHETRMSNTGFIRGGKYTSAIIRKIVFLKSCLCWLCRYSLWTEYNAYIIRATARRCSPVSPNKNKLHYRAPSHLIRLSFVDWTTDFTKLRKGHRFMMSRTSEMLHPSCSTDNNAATL